MAAPAFVQASAGTVITTGTGTPSLTGCVAGNLIIAVMVADGTGADWSIGTFVNVEMLNGTDSDMDAIAYDQAIGAPSAHYSVFIGRVMANGTVSFQVSVGGSGNDLFARIYEFSGVSVGTTLASVIENSASTFDVASGTGTTISDVAVVTNNTDRLALQFISVDANQALAAFTGETGGDWAEPVAEFASASGTAATTGLQTATIAAAGTINGGTITIGSAGWGIMGFALIPSASGPSLDTTLPDADVTTTGWSTAPLFSKVNDSSDATVITATAS